MTFSSPHPPNCSRRGSKSHRNDFSWVRFPIQFVKISTIHEDSLEIVSSGPGPSNCSPEVCAAGSLPIIGHMHAEIFRV